MTEVHVIATFLVIAFVARQALIYIDAASGYERACLEEERENRINAKAPGRLHAQAGQLGYSRGERVKLY